MGAGVALGAWGGDDAFGAWEWLRGAASEYLELGPRIFDLRHEAARVAYEAAQANDDVRAAEARASIERLTSLYDRWDKGADAVRKVQGWGRVSPGLGAVVGPWVYVGLGAATVVAAAATAAYVLARFSAEARIVQLLAEGSLEPGQAERLLAETEGGAAGLGNLASLMLVAVGGVLLWNLTRK